MSVLKKTRHLKYKIKRKIHQKCQCEGSKRTNSPNVDANWENWNEESLDYEDEKMLEKKRQILERELAKGSSESENDQTTGKKMLAKVVAKTPPQHSVRI